MSAKILIVEDDVMQRQMLGTLLHRKLGYESMTAEHGREAIDILEGHQGQGIKLIILDLEMPVMGGMETLDILQQQHPSIPVIMLTGSKDVKDAVDAMKRGAIDFLTKPYEGDRMMITVKNALKISLLSKEVSRLKSEKDGHFTFEHLIGHDGGLAQTVQIGRKAAVSNIPVLVTGETGTGKEVFAKAIHGESDRAGKPFIAVNCGAIPSQLVESTLFGHEKGAFTGATDKALGKFREAEGGTIFLDEVGELPLDTQVKLLRVLQQKEVEPVGAGKPIPVNVRIVSATNRDLEQEVKDHRFREDLYFRLNVLHIDLPPLRDRKSDIALLANHFIERFCADHNALPKNISQAVYTSLETHNWPGNIRELENTINRAMVVSDGDELKLSISSDTPQQSISTSQPLSIPLLDETGTFKTMDVIEKEAIHAVLDHCNKNITQAAKTVGIAKSTFYKKIKILFVCVIIFTSMPFGAQAEEFFQWSTSNMQLLRGHDFELGERQRTIVTLENAHVHKFGDTFSWIDFIKPDGQDYTYYGEISPRLSLSKITGQDFSYGIIEDILISTTFEKAKDQGPQYLYGGAIDFNFTGFKFFRTNAYVHDSTELDGQTWQVTVVWNRPFEVGGVGMLVEGFADFQGSEGSRAPNQLVVPRFLIDAGDLAGQTPGKLMVGIEYSYWHNKFGLDGVTESLPQAQLIWTF